MSAFMTSTTAAECLPIDLNSYFSSTEDQINNILSGNAEKNDELIDNLLETLDKCSHLVESESLFSRNEEYDDIQTSSLKYLAIKYYQAKMNAQIMNLLVRKDHLIQSTSFFKEYIELCQQLHIIDKDDTSYIIDSYDSKPSSAENSRSMKIAKYKKEKETQQKMEVIKFQYSSYSIFLSCVILSKLVNIK